MKNLILIIPFTILFSGCGQKNVNESAGINPVIGDLSVKYLLKNVPDLILTEAERITIHLAFVEKILRQKDVSYLPPHLKEKRENLLDLLVEYYRAGIFPKNQAFPGKRVPCFIDDDGRICAVGYLVEKTAGRNAAEEINKKFQYENLLAMKDPKLDEWISTSGLSKLECAMIQPAYSQTPIYYRSTISRTDAAVTGVVSGLNAGLSAFNLVNITGKSHGNVLPIVSIGTGIGQAAYGFNQLLNTEPDDSFFTSYPSNDTKKLAMFNIGLGTCSAVMGVCNLALNRQRKNKSTAVNLYGYPAGKNLAVGFSLTRRI